jgi:hypothetical protein
MRSGEAERSQTGGGDFVFIFHEQEAARPLSDHVFKQTSIACRVEDRKDPYCLRRHSQIGGSTSGKGKGSAARVCKRKRCTTSASTTSFPALGLLLELVIPPGTMSYLGEVNVLRDYDLPNNDEGGSVQRVLGIERSGDFGRPARSHRSSRDPLISSVSVNKGGENTDAPFPRRLLINADVLKDAQDTIRLRRLPVGVAPRLQKGGTSHYCVNDVVVRCSGKRPPLRWVGRLSTSFTGPP